MFRHHDQRGHVVVACLLAASALLAVMWPSSSEALPLYSARAGRTCDNCHSLPNLWYNPDEISRRKCTLSCMSCHIDPNGGGLRVVSGRYFGLNTLPRYWAEDRPLDDLNPDEIKAWLDSVGAQSGSGEPVTEPTSDAAKPRSAPTSDALTAPRSAPTSDAAAAPGSAPTSDRAVDTRAQIPDRQVDPRPPGSPEPTRGPVFFKPLGHGTSEMAWLDGRYGELAADPLLMFGGDFRVAAWSPGPLFFPMQADLHLAVKPVKHLTIATTSGLRGRSGGVDEIADDPNFLTVRDAWAMTHEWPLMSYLRVGRFLPAFGTRTADHTAYIRRAFGLTQEDPLQRVIGVEVGMAPNYPYFNAAAFKTSGDDLANPFDLGDGEGASVNLGWRDLGWQLGGSFMIRDRNIQDGGDTQDFSLQWAYNPWFYFDNVPLTYLGELTWGLRERPRSASDTFQLATYHQLAWTIDRGIIARLEYNFWDPDQEIIDDEVHRPGLGVDVTWIPGLTTSLDIRGTTPVGGEPNVDALLQIHGWF